MFENTCPNCGNNIGTAFTCPHCEHYRLAIPEVKPAKKYFSRLIIIMIFLCFLTLATAVLIRNYSRKPAAHRITECMSNEKNIGTALEMYASDHEGRYPVSLSQLVPDYMTQLPTCRAAKTDTYSQTYVSSSKVNTYTFYCKGENHTQCTEKDYPQFTSREGLFTRP